MDKQLLEQTDDLFKRLERIDKFASKFRNYPYSEARVIVPELNKLAESVPEVESPQTKDEVIQNELKRRLKGEASNLELSLSGGHYDFNKVVSVFNIPTEDIQGLRPWLEANRDEAIKATGRLFEGKDIKNYDMGLPVDIPKVRREAEEFAGGHISRYHKKIGALLQKLTKVGGFLRDVEAVATERGRSYFQPLSKQLAIGIPAICYISEDGIMHIRERDLIMLYGHEGMGHALNQVVTDSNGLPSFLKKNSQLILSTAESVAQFYQNVIFEDLKRSPETQKDLEIEHKFDEIYQEAQDANKLEYYDSRLFQYAITVLADKELGKPQDTKTIKKKIALLNEVTISPDFPVSFVEGNKNNFDSQGNLSPSLVRELIYCANPVQRALKEFEKQGMTYEKDRSTIDSLLLNGFWSPIGYVDNARIASKERK